MIDQREAIAYHEAGHAVVSMKLGYKCLYVTIIPDGSRLGHVCCEDPLIGGHDDKIKHALKVLLGARLAEGRHVGSPTWGDADERVKATNLALLATDRDTERAETLINEMIQETRKLVEQSLARDRSAGKAVTRQATGQLLRDLRELQLLTKKTCASRETPLRLLISEDLPSPLAHDPDYDGCWQLSWDLKKSRKERRSGRVGAAMADWTAERIAALPTAQIKILRENAARCANDTVAALCDEAIAKRGPSRERSLRVKRASAPRTDEVVVGFHFVCPQGKGVTTNGDGTVWTGTWVVDKVHAEHGSKRGAYVALHVTKSEPSYLQGILKDWRRTRREQECAEGRAVKTEFGVDFLLTLTDEVYEWCGDGAGEKGYAWGKS